MTTRARVGAYACSSRARALSNNYRVNSGSKTGPERNRQKTGESLQRKSFSFPVCSTRYVWAAHVKRDCIFRSDLLVAVSRKISNRADLLGFPVCVTREAKVLCALGT
jgi:hypothetical protein